jgi:tetratricopeptide (TPR) repeat protein
VDAHLARGEALLNSGRTDEARQEFTGLLKVDPSNAFFLHRLGRIELLSNNQAGAIALFNKALETNPNLVDVIRDYLDASAKGGDFQKAQAVADRFLKTTARKDIVHMFKGEMYLSERKFAEAEAQFRKAIALEPKNFGAYLLLGQTKQAQNQLPEAIREVDNLIKRQPDFAPAYMLKGFYMESAGDPKGAIAHYLKTLELNPDNAVAANNVAWLYCESNQNLEQALSLARKARETDPNNAHIADTLGWIYYRMGNYTLAADQLEFAINHGLQKPANYYRHGMACYRKGDKAHAKQSLRKAIELNAPFPGAEEAKKVLQELG